MTNQLHPILDDLVPSVVTTIYRRFRTYTERGDLLQEAWAFVLSRAEHFNDVLSEENEVQRKWNEKKIAWQIRRALERYARKEKASKSGYQLNDEAYYDTVTIAQLLPFVIKSFISETALEQSQILINVIDTHRYWVRFILPDSRPSHSHRLSEFVSTWVVRSN